MEIDVTMPKWRTNKKKRASKQVVWKRGHVKKETCAWFDSIDVGETA